MKKSHTCKTETDSPHATYQDVLDTPPNLVAEIVEGMLYTHPRPAPPHAVAHTRLGYRIGPPFDFGDGGPGGWRIIIEPELHLGKDILVPDIAGWRRERMPELPATAYFTLAPDWVCELLSPSTRELDLGSKRGVYAREGVRYLWLVDPDVRTLEAFELRGTRFVLIETLIEDVPVSLPPFEAISFSLGDLWSSRVLHKKPPGNPATESEPELIGISK